MTHFPSWSASYSTSHSLSQKNCQLHSQLASQAYNQTTTHRRSDMNTCWWIQRRPRHRFRTCEQRGIHHGSYWEGCQRGRWCSRGRERWPVAAPWCPSPSATLDSPWRIEPEWNAITPTLILHVNINNKWIVIWMTQYSAVMTATPVTMALDRRIRV